MIRAVDVTPAGDWPADQAVGAVVLGHHDRHRRRLLLVTDRGREVLLDLARATVLRDGDGLALDDGGWVAVRAAPEDLIEASAATPDGLVRLAWHLGNRHCPAQLLPGCLRLQDDPVITGMLRGLGATLTRVRAPFDPEPGAYGTAPAPAGHGHDHGHDHDHGHAHDHDRGHAHGHGHDLRRRHE